MIDFMFSFGNRYRFYIIEAGIDMNWVDMLGPGFFL